MRAPHGPNDGERDIDVAAWPRVRPPLKQDPSIEARLEGLLAGMTAEQKVGQVIQADIGSVTPDDVRAFHLGSVLNGGNSAPHGVMNAAPAEWLALADAFWEASLETPAKIPIVWGADAIHGNNNVAGATIFPHAINIGATRDLDLAERIGAATALEMAVTGLDWTFSPTVAVVQDVRWGRTFEAFSADPALVSELGGAFIRGLQGRLGATEFLGAGKVIATAKHFVGDGGVGEGRDQGDTHATETELRDVHAAPYAAAIAAGVQSIMASFSSWGGRKLHGRADLLTDLLKERWGFDSVVVGDWNGHGQLPGSTAENSPGALIAGLDVYMAPDSWRGLYRSTLQALRDGVIPMARLDDAVRRMLRLKLRAGMFEKPKPSARPFAGRFELLSRPEHIALAREAVSRSAVLLKNHDALLPLRADKKILVAGDSADNFSRHCGGWTLSWQGQNLSQADFPQSETLLQGIARAVREGGGAIEHAPDGAWRQRPDVAIVVFGEEPYAEFRGDLETLDYRPGDGRDYAIVRKLQSEGIPVVSVFLSGRPLWVNPALNASDAFVAAFLPGGHGGALADLLFGARRGGAQVDFHGKLPFAWPRDADQSRLGPAGDAEPLFPIGFGLSFKDRKRLRKLHERAIATSVDPHTLFNLGAAQGGWSLSVEDEAGATTASGPAFNSPKKKVCVHAVDLGQQENAVAASWTGGDGGQIVFRHLSLDLTRDANAGCCVALQYAAPHAPPRLALRVGLEDASGNLAMLGIEVEVKSSALALVEVPLKAFQAAGADMANIVALRLEARAPLEIVIAKVAVAAMTAGTGVAPSSAP